MEFSIKGLVRHTLLPTLPSHQSYDSMLVLDGIALTFFRVASVKLCFEFVLETMLITQGCLVTAEHQ